MEENSKKNSKIMKALGCCANVDMAGCKECPYNGETRGGKTCRAWLLVDAAFVLEHEMTKNAMLGKELDRLHDAQENAADEIAALRTRCAALGQKHGGEPAHVEEEFTFDLNLPAWAGEVNETESSEAAYWHGQTDALKWFIAGYHGDKGFAYED